MKITLDSTILVRAFADVGGVARRLLFAILDGNHTLVLSSEILAETSRVLRYPRMKARHGMQDEPIYQYVMFLKSVATMVRPDPLMIAPIRDPNDIVVLQTGSDGRRGRRLYDRRRFLPFSGIGIFAIGQYNRGSRYRTHETDALLNDRLGRRWASFLGFSFRMRRNAWHVGTEWEACG